jgi:hypothetical protein
MRPACRLGDRARLSYRIVEDVEADIGVGLQYAAVARQMPHRILSAPISGDELKNSVGQRGRPLRTDGRHAHRSTAGRCAVWKIDRFVDTTPA